MGKDPYWFKTLGFRAREERLRDDWKNERGGLLLRFATFPKERRPRIETGDGIVYYAAGYGVIFAAGKTTSLPFLDMDDDSRWPYRVRVSLTHALVHPRRRAARQHQQRTLAEPLDPPTQPYPVGTRRSTRQL